MQQILPLVALVLTLGALALAGAAVWSLRRRRLVRTSVHVLLAALVFSWAVLAGLLGVGIQGYHALTREELAAVVFTKPLGPHRFQARFRFPDGQERTFELRGDELYVDARILKWKPVANVLGLHTAYRLDRVSGRYLDIADERAAVRTVHGLMEDSLVDLFDLRRRYAMLAPLVDAEYGSASYVPADRSQRFELRVSTSGLLIRRAESP